jgi:hypothetical protein
MLSFTLSVPVSPGRSHRYARTPDPETYLVVRRDQVGVQGETPLVPESISILVDAKKLIDFLLDPLHTTLHIDHNGKMTRMSFLLQNSDFRQVETELIR